MAYRPRTGFRTDDFQNCLRPRCGFMLHLSEVATAHVSKPLRSPRSVRRPAVYLALEWDGKSMMPCRMALMTATVRLLVRSLRIAFLI